MKYRKYSKKEKEKIVKEYLEGIKRHNEICNYYEINSSQLAHWKKQWIEFKDFPDGRGKTSKKGINKKISSKGFTKDEYIKKLEMEVDILKYMAFLKKKKQK